MPRQPRWLPDRSRSRNAGPRRGDPPSGGGKNRPAGCRNACFRPFCASAHRARLQSVGAPAIHEARSTEYRDSRLLNRELRFRNAFAHRPDIARVSCGQPLNPNKDASPGARVPQAVQPLGVDLCLANIEHARNVASGLQSVNSQREWRMAGQSDWPPLSSIASSSFSACPTGRAVISPGYNRVVPP